MVCLLGVLDEAGHLLLQLEHKHPILGIFVKGINDELCD